MNLAAVMDELGDKLDSVVGLRVYRYPPDSLQPPAAIVSYPESYDYDETMGRGMDRMVIPVVLVVGRASDRASRDQLGPYLDGSGVTSVKQAVESGSSIEFDAVRATGAEFDMVQIAGVDYVAATVRFDVFGQGQGA